MASKIENQLEAATRALGNARKRLRAGTERMKAMTSDFIEDGIQIASTALAAYWEGAWEKYDIMGFSPNVVVGIPLALGGIALAFWGMEDLGRWVGAVGKGLITAWVFKKAYLAGFEKAHGAGTPATIAGAPANRQIPAGEIDPGSLFAKSQRHAGAYRR